jgi:hypothetical protein
MMIGSRTGIEMMIPEGTGIEGRIWIGIASGGGIEMTGID